MSSKLFVGGLSWSTTDLTLRQLFETHGAIQEANIVIDRETGRSRGFGFVTFADQYSAKTAISALNGKDLDGRNIVVSVAEDKARSDRNRNGNRKFQQDRW
ncbi:RNA recognition motif domain-containing protein [Leptospira saintgironsiae]|uniref:RNA-binding protein n=1 Tax=Leptospira saintgironsiae TaxID=2023183 RepID=A0A2M9YB26_9LEPT|nr:RNA-binding protein [Leptospira saintgironsiae]PJZ48784.1 RNA-binding protein [Leptospira saintgironsiae]